MGSGQYQARVTEIRSPDHLYLQTSDAQKVLSEIEKLISTSDLETVPKDWQAKERDFVFCRFSQDNNWYRARVIRYEKGLYHVSYVDFGNEEKVKHSALRPMPKSDSSRLPHQANEAFLAYVRIPREASLAMNYVTDFCLEKDLLVNHEYTIGRRIYVTIYDSTGKFSLNADLIRNGMAFVSTNEYLTTGEHKGTYEKPLQ